MIPEIIRPLTIKQPFASLMLHGKEYETRSRATSVRGWVLICAGKMPYELIDCQMIAGVIQGIRIDSILNLDRCRDWSFLPTGKAIGLGKIVDCRQMTLKDEDKCFVDFYSALWCWVFEGVRAIEPFDFKGSVGWSGGIISDEIRKKIKFL